MYGKLYLKLIKVILENISLQKKDVKIKIIPAIAKKVKGFNKKWWRDMERKLIWEPIQISQNTIYDKNVQTHCNLGKWKLVTVAFHINQIYNNIHKIHILVMGIQEEGCHESYFWWRCWAFELEESHYTKYSLYFKIHKDLCTNMFVAICYTATTNENINHYRIQSSYPSVVKFLNYDTIILWNIMQSLKIMNRSQPG